MGFFSRNSAAEFIAAESEQDAAQWIANQLRYVAREFRNGKEFSRCYRASALALQSPEEAFSSLDEAATADELKFLDSLVAFCIEQASSREHFERKKREFSSKENLRMFGAQAVQANIDEFRLMRTPQGRQVPTGWYLRAQKLAGSRRIVAGILAQQLLN